MVGTFFDDFEDGDADGWVDNTGSKEVVEESATGTYSMTIVTTGDGQHVRWESGPVIDMTEAFEIEAVFRYIWVDGSNDSHHVRFGLEPGEGDGFALLMFNAPYDAIFLGENRTATATTSGSNAMSGAEAFEGEWINIRMWSEGDEDVLYAKVWSFGSDEPDDAQIYREFEGVEGPFRVDVGGDSRTVRRPWLDQITIEGTRVDNSEFVFESTQAVGLGDHDDEFVFADDESPVQDDGESEYLKIRDSPIVRG